MTDQSAGSVLSTRAMLAKLSISQWTAKRFDRRVTAETNRAHGASDDAGRYTKSLVAKEALARYAQITGAAREYFLQITSPWMDDGTRLLNVAIYPAFVEKMRGFREDAEAEAATIVDKFPDLVEQARIALNGLFDPADYPAPSEVAKKFGLTVRLFPVPTVADWRVDLGEESAAILKADVEMATREALALATRDAWERIAEVVGRMAERLSGYKPAKAKGEKTENAFRDSLVTNVRDLVSLLPILNLSNDPRLASICELMQEDLCEYDADQLRDDERARATTARAAQAILDEVSSFLA